MESRSLSSLHDFGDVSVLCTFLNIPAAAAEAGIVRNLQLSSSMPGQAVQYVTTGGTNHRPSTQLGRAGRCLGSILYGLRPLGTNAAALSRKLKSRYGARNQFQEPSLELSSQAT